MFLIFIARQRIELAGNLKVEERGEPRVLGNKGERHRFGKQIAKRFVTGEERVGAIAVKQCAGIEAVFGAERCNEFGALALFDVALDDHKHLLGARPRPDDALTGTKIADIERRPKPLNLLRRQAVKRGVISIKGLRHMAILPPDRVVLFGQLPVGDQIVDHARVGERRGIAQAAKFILGDLAQNTAHNLARSRFG